MSRSNYNTINDRIDDDTDDRHSRSIRELEEEAQSAMEWLSRAQNDRDSSRQMDSHHSVGSDVNRCGHATDKNIPGNATVAYAKMVSKGNPR